MPIQGCGKAAVYAGSSFGDEEGRKALVSRRVPGPIITRSGCSPCWAMRLRERYHVNITGADFRLARVPIP